jgi:hypothetical protein
MSDFIQFLNTNAGAIQAISTVVLIIITIYYTYQSQLAVTEASNTRMDMRLPIIQVEIEGPIEEMVIKKERYMELTFKNVGYGIARNIEARLPGKDPATLRSLDVGAAWSVSVPLKPGEAEKIDALPLEEKTILVKYEDIFSRKLSTAVHFDNAHENAWITFRTTRWSPILPE